MSGSHCGQGKAEETDVRAKRTVVMCEAFMIVALGASRGMGCGSMKNSAVGALVSKNPYTSIPQLQRLLESCRAPKWCRWL